MKKQEPDIPVVAFELIEAYRSTHFNVLGPRPFTLKVGEFSRDLKELYKEHGVSSAAFLTAWNPYSELTAQSENEAAQQRLEKILEQRSFEICRGVGIDVSGGWLGEPSVLVLGISQEDAAWLGNEFRQNAIVWIGSDSIPDLIFLR
jgi:hypothetical protein